MRNYHSSLASASLGAVRKFTSTSAHSPATPKCLVGHRRYGLQDSAAQRTPRTDDLWVSSRRAAQHTYLAQCERRKAQQRWVCRLSRSAAQKFRSSEKRVLRSGRLVSQWDVTLRGVSLRAEDGCFYKRPCVLANTKPSCRSDYLLRARKKPEGHNVLTRSSNLRVTLDLTLHRC
jgi:hypothetical protein